jgi:xanthine/uracil permease
VAVHASSAAIGAGWIALSYFIYSFHAFETLLVMDMLPTMVVESLEALGIVVQGVPQTRSTFSF